MFEFRRADPCMPNCISFSRFCVLATKQSEPQPPQKKQRRQERRGHHWTASEEQVLRHAVQEYGEGHWATILEDDTYSYDLRRWDNHALKDKWRNMKKAILAQAQGLGVVESRKKKLSEDEGASCGQFYFASSSSCGQQTSSVAHAPQVDVFSSSLKRYLEELSAANVSINVLESDALLLAPCGQFMVLNLFRFQCRSSRTILRTIWKY